MNRAANKYIENRSHSKTWTFAMPDELKLPAEPYIVAILEYDDPIAPINDVRWSHSQCTAAPVVPRAWQPSVLQLFIVDDHHCVRASKREA
jgi:hypothetical protein